MTNRLTLRLTDAETALLDALCGHTGETRQQCLRRLLSASSDELAAHRAAQRQNWGSALDRMAAAVTRQRRADELRAELEALHAEADYASDHA